MNSLFRNVKTINIPTIKYISRKVTPSLSTIESSKLDTFSHETQPDSPRSRSLPPMLNPFKTNNLDHAYSIDMYPKGVRIENDICHRDKPIISKPTLKIICKFRRNFSQRSVSRTKTKQQEKQVDKRKKQDNSRDRFCEAPCIKPEHDSNKKKRQFLSKDKMIEINSSPRRYQLYRSTSAPKLNTSSHEKSRSLSAFRDLYKNDPVKALVHLSDEVKFNSRNDISVTPKKNKLSFHYLSENSECRQCVSKNHRRFTDFFRKNEQKMKQYLHGRRQFSTYMAEPASTRCLNPEEISEKVVQVKDQNLDSGWPGSAVTLFNLVKHHTNKTKSIFMPTNCYKFEAKNIPEDYQFPTEKKSSDPYPLEMFNEDHIVEELETAKQVPRKTESCPVFAKMDVEQEAQPSSAEKPMSYLHLDKYNTFYGLVDTGASYGSKESSCITPDFKYTETSKQYTEITMKPEKNGLIDDKNNHQPDLDKSFGLNSLNPIYLKREEELNVDAKQMEIGTDCSGSKMDKVLAPEPQSISNPLNSHPSSDDFTILASKKKEKPDCRKEGFKKSRWKPINIKRDKPFSKKPNCHKDRPCGKGCKGLASTSTHNEYGVELSELIDRHAVSMELGNKKCPDCGTGMKRAPCKVPSVRKRKEDDNDSCNKPKENPNRCPSKDKCKRMSWTEASDYVRNAYSFDHISLELGKKKCPDCGTGVKRTPCKVPSVRKRKEDDNDSCNKPKENPNRCPSKDKCKRMSSPGASDYVRNAYSFDHISLELGKKKCPDCGTGVKRTPCRVPSGRNSKNDDNDPCNKPKDKSNICPSKDKCKKLSWQGATGILSKALSFDHIPKKSPHMMIMDNSKLLDLFKTRREESRELIRSSKHANVGQKSVNSKDMLNQIHEALSVVPKVELADNSKQMIANSIKKMLQPIIEKEFLKYEEVKAALERIEKHLSLTLSTLQPVSSTALVESGYRNKWHLSNQWHKRRQNDIAEKSELPEQIDPRENIYDHQDPLLKINSIRTPSRERKESYNEPNNQVFDIFTSNDTKQNMLVACKQNKFEDSCQKADEMFKKGKKVETFSCLSKNEKKADPSMKADCGQKKDPCNKKEDPCKKKEDPCKKKEDPCKTQEDPCKKKEDPCKKKEDPCKKQEDPCKKKEDPCKTKEDPCKKKEDPCKKQADSCKKQEDPCKKQEDPCKKKEDPCKKHEDPCKKNEDPCKKPKPDKKSCDPCARPETVCKIDPCDSTLCKKEEPSCFPASKPVPATCEADDPCDTRDLKGASITCKKSPVKECFQPCKPATTCNLKKEFQRKDLECTKCPTTPRLKVWPPDACQKPDCCPKRRECGPKCPEPDLVQCVQKPCKTCDGEECPAIETNACMIKKPVSCTECCKKRDTEHGMAGMRELIKCDLTQNPPCPSCERQPEQFLPMESAHSTANLPSASATGPRPKRCNKNIEPPCNPEAETECPIVCQKNKDECLKKTRCQKDDKYCDVEILQKQETARQKRADLEQAARKKNEAVCTNPVVFEAETRNRWMPVKIDSNKTGDKNILKKTQNPKAKESSLKPKLKASSSEASNTYKMASSDNAPPKMAPSKDLTLVETYSEKITDLCMMIIRKHKGGKKSAPIVVTLSRSQPKMGRRGDASGCAAVSNNASADDSNGVGGRKPNHVDYSTFTLDTKEKLRDCMSAKSKTGCTSTPKLLKNKMEVLNKNEEDPSKKKKDQCKKKEESCKKEKKSSSHKQKSEPCIPCKYEVHSKKEEDACKKKEDPCKKKEDPCKKKEDPCKKKEDPCKKKEDPCKKKEDTCKKKEDPCKKKEDPCKKKEDPCKKKEDPCKKKEDPCKKKDDPCKKKEDPCKKKEDPCKKKEDPCKKKEDPTKKKCTGKRNGFAIPARPKSRSMNNFKQNHEYLAKKKEPASKNQNYCNGKKSGAVDPKIKELGECLKRQRSKGLIQEHPTTKNSAGKNQVNPCHMKKKDPCEKKEDPCKKKDDPCKKKEDPCKKKDDPCKKKEDPCKKKDDPCKKKEDPCKKKVDPCKKKEDPCKKKDDPCKKKEDPCKKKDDPCKKKEDPCKKKEDPCKKKEDPCKKKEDPCKKKEDPCKKKNKLSNIHKSEPCIPCKHEDYSKKHQVSSKEKEDPCKKKEDPCKKKEDPCMKKEDPCKKSSNCEDSMNKPIIRATRKAGTKKSSKDIYPWNMTNKGCLHTKPSNLDCNPKKVNSDPGLETRPWQSARPFCMAFEPKEEQCNKAREVLLKKLDEEMKKDECEDQEEPVQKLVVKSCKKENTSNSGQDCQKPADFSKDGALLASGIPTVSRLSGFFKNFALIGIYNQLLKKQSMSLAKPDKLDTQFALHTSTIARESNCDNIKTGGEPTKVDRPFTIQSCKMKKLKSATDLFDRKRKVDSSLCIRDYCKEKEDTKAKQCSESEKQTNDAKNDFLKACLKIAREKVSLPPEYNSSKTNPCTRANIKPKLLKNKKICLVKKESVNTIIEMDQAESVNKYESTGSLHEHSLNSLNICKINSLTGKKSSEPSTDPMKKSQKNHHLSSQENKHTRPKEDEKSSALSNTKIDKLNQCLNKQRSKPIGSEDSEKGCTGTDSKMIHEKVEICMKDENNDKANQCVKKQKGSEETKKCSNLKIKTTSKISLKESTCIGTGSKKGDQCLKKQICNPRESKDTQKCSTSGNQTTNTNSLKESTCIEIDKKIYEKVVKCIGTGSNKRDKTVDKLNQCVTHQKDKSMGSKDTKKCSTSKEQITSSLKESTCIETGSRKTDENVEKLIGTDSKKKDEKVETRMVTCSKKRDGNVEKLNEGLKEQSKHLEPQNPEHSQGKKFCYKVSDTKESVTSKVGKNQHKKENIKDIFNIRSLICDHPGMAIDNTKKVIAKKCKIPAIHEKEDFSECKYLKKKLSKPIGSEDSEKVCIGIDSRNIHENVEIRMKAGSKKKGEEVDACTETGLKKTDENNEKSNRSVKKQKGSEETKKCSNLKIQTTSKSSLKENTCMGTGSKKRDENVAKLNQCLKKQICSPTGSQGTQKCSTLKNQTTNKNSLKESTCIEKNIKIDKKVVKCIGTGSNETDKTVDKLNQCVTQQKEKSMGSEYAKKCSTSSEQIRSSLKENPCMETGSKKTDKNVEKLIGTDSKKKYEKVKTIMVTCSRKRDEKVEKLNECLKEQNKHLEPQNTEHSQGKKICYKVSGTKESVTSKVGKNQYKKDNIIECDKIRKALTKPKTSLMYEHPGMAIDKTKKGIAKKCQIAPIHEKEEFCKNNKNKLCEQIQEALTKPNAALVFNHNGINMVDEFKNVIAKECSESTIIQGKEEEIQATSENRVCVQKALTKPKSNAVCDHPGMRLNDEPEKVITNECETDSIQEEKQSLVNCRPIERASILDEEVYPSKKIEEIVSENQCKKAEDFCNTKKNEKCEQNRKAIVCDHPVMAMVDESQKAGEEKRSTICPVQEEEDICEETEEVDVSKDQSIQKGLKNLTTLLPGCEQTYVKDMGLLRQCSFKIKKDMRHPITEPATDEELECAMREGKQVVCKVQRLGQGEKLVCGQEIDKNSEQCLEEPDFNEEGVERILKCSIVRDTNNRLKFVCSELLSKKEQDKECCKPSTKENDPKSLPAKIKVVSNKLICRQCPASDGSDKPPEVKCKLGIVEEIKSPAQFLRRKCKPKKSKPKPAVMTYQDLMRKCRENSMKQADDNVPGKKEMDKCQKK